MKIYDITDPTFDKYGAIVRGYDFSELLEKMRQKPIPEAVEYVASDPVLEALPVFPGSLRILRRNACRAGVLYGA